MKQLANCLSLVLLGSVAIAAGCSTSMNTPGNDGGGNTGAGGSTSKLQALLPDPTGYVDVGATGMTMIKGAWYAYGDGIGSDGTSATGDCELKGMHAVSDCSAITTPSFGTFPNTPGKMCTAGTAAKIANLVTWDHARLQQHLGRGHRSRPQQRRRRRRRDEAALQRHDERRDRHGLRHRRGAAGRAARRVPDQDRHQRRVLGRRSEAVAGQDRATTRSCGARSTVRSTTLVAPPFDPTTIFSIQFHIPTSTTASATYNFCISNLSAILQ